MSLGIQPPELLLGVVLLAFAFLPGAEQPAGEHGARRGVGSVEDVGVERGELDRGVQGRGGRAPDYQRGGHAPRGHLAAQVLHLVERRRYQAAHSDYVGAAGGGLVEYGLSGHHHPHVADTEAVAAHDYADYVLAYVVDVALDSGEQHQGFPALLALVAGVLLDVGLQDVHGLAHDPGRLDHLRQEHLPFGETLAHGGHSGHQRAFYHVHGFSAFGKAAQHVLPERVGASSDEGPADALSGVQGAAGSVCRGFLPGLVRLSGLLLYAGRLRQQPFGRSGVGVEYHVAHAFEQLRFDFVVDPEHRGIHYPHVEAGLYRMVEEHGVHGLPDGVVAAESEREVRDASGGQGSGEIGLYPSDGLDEVDGVARMLGYSGAHSQHSGVEYDVAGLEAEPVGQQAVGAGADFGLSREVGGLPLFVEGHHCHRGAQSAGFAGLLEKAPLALLERYGVHYALPLGVLESGEHRVPVGGVHHDRRSGHRGLVGGMAQELLHLGARVEHRVVHVHVHHRSSALELRRRHREGLGVVLRRDEPRELPGAGHVGPLGYVGEIAAAVYRDGLEPADVQAVRFRRTRPAGAVPEGFRDGGYVLGSGAAAASGNVEQAVAGDAAELGGHCSGSLVVCAHFVGQAGVGVEAHGAFRP